MQVSSSFLTLTGLLGVMPRLHNEDNKHQSEVKVSHITVRGFYAYGRMHQAHRRLQQPDNRKMKSRKKK